MVNYKVTALLHRETIDNVSPHTCRRVRVLLLYIFLSKY